MPLKFADRVAESTVTPGTGDIFLAGPIDADHASFASQFSDGDLVPVSVFGGGKWMTCVCRYNAGPNSLTRVTFRDSSTGSNIGLSGTMTVMCGWGAADAAAMLRTDEVQALTQQERLIVLESLGATETGISLFFSQSVAAAREVFDLGQSLITEQMLLRMAVSRALGMAQYAGTSFADSFGTLTYVDVSGATNLDVTTGVLKPKKIYAYEGPTGGGVVSSYSTGGYTLVDRGYTLENGAMLVGVRLYSANAQSVKFKIAQRNSPGNYTIVFSETFAHPGGGQADFVMSSPYRIPVSGAFYPATYSAGNVGTYYSGPRSYILGDANGTASGYAEDVESTAIVRVKYDAGSYESMTVSTASIVLPSIPKMISPILRVKHGVAAVAGDDYKVYLSRNGGVNYSGPSVLTDRFVDQTDGAHIVVGAAVDMSGQPSGTDVRMQVVTANGKDIGILDWGFSVRGW